MKEKVWVFNGLYGDNSLSPVLEFMNAETLETRSKMYNWEINEHLHTDLVQIFIIESGDGALFSGKKETILKGPCVIFIPSNALHGFKFQDNIKGDVITFADSILDNIFKQNQKIFLEFNQIKYYDLGTRKPELEQISICQRLLIKEINQEQIEKLTLINALLLSFFILIFRQKSPLDDSTQNVDNKTLIYFQAFQKSIRRDLLSSKTIREYAKEMGLSTTHLNRICKTIVNKSPIQLIHELVIKEAKKYLLNTSYSISEITYFLNLNDPAYFTRMFKKNVGVTPTDFRKS